MASLSVDIYIHPLPSHSPPNPPSKPSSSSPSIFSLHLINPSQNLLYSISTLQIPTGLQDNMKCYKSLLLYLNLYTKYRLGKNVMD
jgi:hypothetical protein